MIVVNLDVMMAKRKISSGELSERVGITQANLSILKTGKGKAIRFSTLEKICEVLDCKPGDILDYTNPCIQKSTAHYPVCCFWPLTVNHGDHHLSILEETT